MTKADLGGNIDYYRERERLLTLRVVEMEEKIRELENEIAERKRVEEALCESGQRFRTLAENLPDNIIRYDRHCRAVYFNPMMARTMAFDNERLGKTPMEAYPKREVFRAYEDIIRQVLVSGDSGEMEMPISFSNGDLQTHNIRFVAEKDAAGNIFGVLVIGRDITEHKRLEAELRKREESYRAIFENSPLGIFRSTPEGRFIDVNPALAKMFGYESPEAVIREIHNIFEQLCVQPEECRRIISEQLASAEVSHNFNRYRRKNGSEFLANMYVRTVRDAESRSPVLEGIIEDVTEHKQAEDSLRNSERRLADIINFLPDATFAINLKGEIILWNRAAEKFTGARAEEMLGKGNYEHAIPFYGERRPILIDLVLNPSEEIKRRYPYAKIGDGMIVGEAYTLSVSRGENSRQNFSFK